MFILIFCFMGLIVFTPNNIHASNHGPLYTFPSGTYTHDMALKGLPHVCHALSELQP